MLWLELFAVLLLFIVRIYRLDSTGVFDYDSAKNLLIIKELCAVDFQNLFHHASPTFYLFLTPFYKISGDFLVLEYICALLSALSIPIFGRTFQSNYHLSPTAYFFLLLSVGTSTFLVVSARNLAIESLSLPIFALLLHYYLSEKLTEQSKWRIISLLSALLFTINYKIIPFFLILFFVEILKHKRLDLSRWLFFGLSILSAVGFYSFMSWVLNMEALLYLKNIYAQAFVKDMNPTKNLSQFNLDLLFYFKYVWDFENLSLWIGWASLIYFKKNAVFSSIKNIFSVDLKRNTLSQIEIVAIISVCFLAGMSVLVKAPRGLLFAYPLLFSFSFVGVIVLLRNNSLRTVYFASVVILNLWNLDRFIYKYSSTNYPKVANWLEDRGSKRLFTSVGLGITPFLPKDIEHENVFRPEQITKATHSKSYILLDDYWKIAQLGDFSKLEDNANIKWKEPSLQSPYLYLELCEFTGNSYEEAILQWEHSKNNTYLVLLPLRNEPSP